MAARFGLEQGRDPLAKGRVAVMEEDVPRVRVEIGHALPGDFFQRSHQGSG